MDFFSHLSATQQFALWSVVKVLCVLFLALLPMVAYSVLAERKISAFIQDRVGPNRVAPPIIGNIPFIGPLLTRWGIWQPLADGLKSFLKEDFTPSASGCQKPSRVRNGPMIGMLPISGSETRFGPTRS